MPLLSLRYLTLLRGGIALAILVWMMGGNALAASSGSAMPWDTALTGLTDMLQGPLVKYVSLIAIFIGGTALIFGEDLGAFSKRLLTILVAASALIGAGSLFTAFVSGAVI